MSEFPPKPYTEADSDFVREKIRAGDFDDEQYREYVNDLLRLERYATEGASGWADAHHRGTLTNRYPDAFDAIQRELAPERYERRMEREAEIESVAELRREYERERERTRSEREKRHRRAWRAVAEEEEDRKRA